MITEKMLQNVVRRIIAGEAVPIRKEYKALVSERLTEEYVKFEIREKESEPERVFFVAVPE